MSSPVRSHNAYHLGDNLIHLNFLRRVALANPDREFIHAAQWQYLKQMKELITDVPNIRLAEFNYLSASNGSIDAWRGSGGFWYQHPDRYDFAKFHVEAWFPHLANRMKVENPIKSVEDMLFDAPAIQEAIVPEELSRPFDLLVINSAPQSGQYHGYDKQSINSLVWILLNAGKKVIATSNVPGIYDDGAMKMIETPCTLDHNLTVTQIGKLSLQCEAILMVPTGPCWTTYNIWNKGKKRIVLLDVERLKLDPNTVHCTGVPAAAIAMQKAGLI